MNLLYDSMGHMASSSENMLLFTVWENSTPQSALFKLNWIEGGEVLCAYCGLQWERLSEFKEIIIGI